MHEYEGEYPQSFYPLISAHICQPYPMDFYPGSCVCGKRTEAEHYPLNFYRAKEPKRR